MPEKQATIKIRESTRRRLDKLRHPGQSYDGIIRELMDSLERMADHEKRIARLERVAKPWFKQRLEVS